jgi:hypothetical protein
VPADQGQIVVDRRKRGEGTSCTVDPIDEHEVDPVYEILDLREGGVGDDPLATIQAAS